MEKRQCSDYSVDMGKTKKRKEDTSHITTSIHKGFYENEIICLPTLLKEYDNIEAIFTGLQYIACISIQVDQLKIIEYKYGSVAYGNCVRKVTAIIRTLMKEKFRKEDIFIVDVFESDTFIIFLSAPRREHTQLLDHLDVLAERARIIIKKSIFELLYPLIKENVTPKIGYALMIKNPMIKNIRQITQLLNESKKMGFFLAERQHYKSKYLLQKIIINQQVTTLFQPIVNLDTMDVIGHEALTRGPDNSEYTSPLVLFIIAEESGLSFELDRLCRKKAFEAIRNCKIQTKIFVNTLTMTIHDPDFRGLYLKELLDDLKVKPENVVFEISERLAIENYDIFKQALKDYTDIGIVHADDDIGKGYSDLERIMELKPGYLKVDIALVRDIDKSYIKQEIIKAMIHLAESINSEIIAEGIETRAEWEKLKALNVKYGQGYLFARPSTDPTAIDISGIK
ncbi:MAG: EAL domain-containing protein [Spirochaetales bacterium]|nr:EAL domain-containing protein [Spirochaetales bacterium]